MKKRTIHNHTLKYLLSIACCLLLILTSANAHAKQKQTKPSHSKNTAAHKVSTKTAKNNSGAGNPKNAAVHKVSAKTAKNNSGSRNPKNKPCPKLSAINTGKKHKTKQTLSKRKSTRKIMAGIATEHRPSLFQYKPSDLQEEKLQEEMKEYIGIPYRSGGASLRGMDCSGFASTIYANLFGIKLPHNSAAQFSFPKLQEIDENELQTGDLVFFSRKRRINHVGVYLGDGNFIHATNGNGIMISSLDDQHWKTRIVGTKRPMSFDKSGMETMHLEGGFDIPLHTGSHIKSYARDEFRPSYDFGSNSGRATAFGEADHEVYDFNNGHQYNYEVEFSHKLLSDTCNVSMGAVLEKLDKASAWNIYDRKLDADWPLYNQFLNGLPSTVRHGFKLASEISPFEGLSITPSFVYLNYDQQTLPTEMMDVPKRIFGLNTQFIPMAGPWSVSMALHYADQLDMVDSLFKSSDTLNAMDMAFKLGFYLSKNLEFSIMGKHDFKDIPNRTDLASSLYSPINSDFMFLLDLKY